MLLSKHTQLTNQLSNHTGAVNWLHNKKSAEKDSREHCTWRHYWEGLLLLTMPKTKEISLQFRKTVEAHDKRGGCTAVSKCFTVSRTAVHCITVKYKETYSVRANNNSWLWMFECGAIVSLFCWSVSQTADLLGFIAKSQPLQWSHKEETSEDRRTRMGRLCEDDIKTKTVPQMIPYNQDVHKKMPA